MQVKQIQQRLTVCYWQRGLYVRVGEPRRFRFSGPAFMVPRLDDRVRPTPPTTHRDNHPRPVQLTRAEHGSVRLTASSLRVSTAAPSVFPSPSPSPSVGAAAAAAGGCCSSLHRQQLTSINTHHLRHLTAPRLSADWLRGMSSSLSSCKYAHIPITITVTL